MKKELKPKKIRLATVGKTASLLSITSQVLLGAAPVFLAEEVGSTSSQEQVQAPTNSDTSSNSEEEQEILKTEDIHSDKYDEEDKEKGGTLKTPKVGDEEYVPEEEEEKDPYQWVTDMFPFLNTDKQKETAAQIFYKDGRVKLNILGFQGNMSLFLGNDGVSLYSDNLVGDNMRIGQSRTDENGNYVQGGDSGVSVLVNYFASSSTAKMHYVDALGGCDLTTTKGLAESPIPFADFNQKYVYNLKINDLSTWNKTNETLTFKDKAELKAFLTGGDSDVKLLINGENFDDYKLKFDPSGVTAEITKYKTFTYNSASNGTAASGLSQYFMSDEQKQMLSKLGITDYVRGLPYAIEVNMNSDAILDSVKVNGKEVKPDSYTSDTLRYKLGTRDESNVTTSIHTKTLADAGYELASPEAAPITFTYGNKILEERTEFTNDVELGITITNMSGGFIRLENSDNLVLSNRLDAVKKIVNTHDLTEKDGLYSKLGYSFKQGDTEVSSSKLVAVDVEAPKAEPVSIDQTPIKQTSRSVTYTTTPTLTLRATDNFMLEKAELIMLVNKKEVKKVYTLPKTNSSLLNVELETGQFKSLVLYDSAGNGKVIDIMTLFPDLRPNIVVHNPSVISIESDILNKTLLNNRYFVKEMPKINVKATPNGAAVISGYSILLNDNEVVNKTVSENAIDDDISGIFNGTVEGLNSILITVFQAGDSKSSSSELSYYYDITPPKILNYNILTTDYLADAESGVLVTDGSFKFTVRATDIKQGLTQSDVSGLGVLQKKNVSTGEVDDIYPEGDTYPIVLSANGQYEFSLTDLAGNIIEELTIGDLIQGFDKSIDKVLIADAQSSVDLTFPEPTYKAEESFYKDAVDGQAKVENTVGIKDWKILINNNKVYGETYSLKEVLNHPTKLIEQIISKDAILKEVKEDGKVHVVVETTNFFGKTVSKEITFRLDLHPPKISKLDILGEYFDEIEGIFSKDPLAVMVEAEDGLDSSGFKEIVAMVDGTVKNSSKGTNKLELKPSEKGEYSFKATDNVGRESDVKTVKDLKADLKSSKFIVDNTKPEVQIEFSKSDYVNEKSEDWYKKEPIAYIKATDNEAILSIEVTVNGQVIETKEYKSSNVKDEKIDFDLSKARASSDGSYKIIVKVKDKARNEHTVEKTVFVDNKAPEVVDFIFQQDGYLEGKTLTSDNSSYGFYFSKPTELTIKLKDEVPSSGVRELKVKLGTQENVVKVTGNSAKIDIPLDFKGHVSATPVDNVGNEGQTKKPDGIITESSNTHINSSKLDISIPDSIFKTAEGFPLYNQDIEASMAIRSVHSGLRQVTTLWNKQETGKTTFDNSGSAQGTQLTKVLNDSNLVTGISTGIKYDKNGNAQVVTLNSKDRAGYESTISTAFGVDKTAPVLSISYDNNVADGKYFKASRVGTLRIVEENFKVSDVKFTGNVPSNIVWAHNGDVHTATIVFNEDKDYKWNVEYTDLAGNQGNSIGEQVFSIDKNPPKIRITYNSDKPAKGNFFNVNRVATITVEEANFTPDKVKVEGATLSGWSSVGTIHTARAVFDEQKEHQWAIQITDLAGNVSEKYQSEKFSIDSEKPKLTIEGVTNGGIYTNDVIPVITYSDLHLDEDSFTYSLEGQKNGVLKDVKIIRSNGRVMIENLPKTKKYDDIYTLTVSIEDKAGNISKDTRKFIVRRFGSEFKLADTEYFDMQYTQNIARDISISESSVTPINLKKARLRVTRNGSNINLSPKDYKIIGRKDQNNFNVYSYTIDKKVFEKEGVYSIYLQSTDVGSNSNDTRDLKMTFAVDKTAPQVFVANVKDRQIYNEDSLEVLVEAKDNLALGNVDVYLNGEKVKDVVKSGSGSLIIRASDNKQELRVVAYDKASNKTDHTVSDFKVTTNIAAKVTKWKGTKYIIAAAALAILGVLGISFKGYADKRKKQKEDEERRKRILEEQALYASSGDTTGFDQRVDLHGTDGDVEITTDETVDSTIDSTVDETQEPNVEIEDATSEPEITQEDVTETKEEPTESLDATQETLQDELNGSKE